MSDPSLDLLRLMPFLSADPATVLEREHGRRAERLQELLASESLGRGMRAEIVRLRRRAG